MPANRWTQSITGLSTTSGYPLYIPDWFNNDAFSLGISVTASSTGTPYNVEGTLGYTGSSAFISTAAIWATISSLAGNSSLIAVTTPVTAIRLNVVSGSSQVVTTMTVVSAC
jgi:hypothetical protein